MKILEFLRKQSEPPEPSSSPETDKPDICDRFFGLYPLQREEGFVISRPLFELMLVRLYEGSAEAIQLADAVALMAGVQIQLSKEPPPPAV